MTQLARELDKKLTTWRPEVAAQVEQIVTDMIESDTGKLVEIHHKYPVDRGHEKVTP